MYIIGKIVVTTVIPDELLKLKEIACNLWWSWNPDAIDLFRDIDLHLWEKLKKNPIHFLQEVSRQKLLDKVNDIEFMKRYRKVFHEFDSYMSSTDTWFLKKYPDKKNHHIAYFSAEYGLNEVLPIYSGGLGVLSGDHCKSASDLGLPFTAVGLFYKQGYFNQSINQEGWQLTEYKDLITSHLPIVPVNDAAGQPICINVDFPGRVVYAKVWQVKIGRVSLYLMDTDIEQNSIQDRMITARLYGGDQDRLLVQ
jgi:starch phosphorylase